MNAVTAAAPDWDRLRLSAVRSALGGWTLFVVVGLTRYFVQGEQSPRQVFLSYLVAFNFWLSIPLGCLLLLMIQYLTGGAWGLLLRRIFEAGVGTLPLLAVLFAPVVVGLFLGESSLYIWAGSLNEKTVGVSVEELHEKAKYLNSPLFIGRGVGCFVCWLALAAVLRRGAVRQDDRNNAYSQFLSHVSGPGLVVYGLTITIASVDWVMSLEPLWYSTIFPLMYAVGQLLVGLAFSIFCFTVLLQIGALGRAVDKQDLRDLGSLLLMAVMFWAYMAFSQFLLIWIGNLPEEIPWYLRRTRGDWQWVALALVILHFALPFLLLLFREIKENPQTLGAVALGLLVIRWLDLFWWIEPAYPHDGQPFFWLLDLAATLGMGGVWVWWFLNLLALRPLLPADALQVEEGLRNG